MKTTEFNPTVQRHVDPWWRKARIAARLLRKKERRQPWSARDQRLAVRLAEDPGVTNRLIDQAVHWFKAPPNNDY